MSYFIQINTSLVPLTVCSCDWVVLESSSGSLRHLFIGRTSIATNLDSPLLCGNVMWVEIQGSIGNCWGHRIFRGDKICRVEFSILASKYQGDNQLAISIAEDRETKIMCRKFMRLFLYFHRNLDLIYFLNTRLTEETTWFFCYTCFEFKENCFKDCIKFE